MDCIFSKTRHSIPARVFATLALAWLNATSKAGETTVTIKDHSWLINSVPVNQGSSCEGLLMNGPDFRCLAP